MENYSSLDFRIEVRSFSVSIQSADIISEWSNLINFPLSIFNFPLHSSADLTTPAAAIKILPIFTRREFAEKELYSLTLGFIITWN